MALLTFMPESEKQTKKQTEKQHSKPRKRNIKKPETKPIENQKQPSSWDQIKNLLTCKQIEDSKIHDPSKINPNGNGHSKLVGSCSSICSFRDVVNGSTRVVHRADNSPESSSVGQETGLLARKRTAHHVHGSSTRSSAAESSRSLGSSMRSHGGGGGGGTTSNRGASRGLQLRKLSGCYECHAVLDASRYPIARSSICVCSECGEVFPKIESLEHHQAVRHAVSELGPEDSGRNIVEIIFKSSWLKKDNPIYSIERILKVHSTRRTIQRFEDCRDAVKIRANANAKKNPRCAADGNELLRFHCTTSSCSLGSRGSSSLCGSVPGCGVCTIIRHGFQAQKSGAGVRTTASSGRAHDSLVVGGGGGIGQARRAMLVCRVIAGKVRRMADDAAAAGEEDGGPYDSVAGYAGVYSNLEELYVFNPRAILPCFVVIYKAIEN